jgi:hypothetical protein
MYIISSLAFTDDSTITSREIQTALLLLLPGTLAKHAAVPGHLLVFDFMSWCYVFGNLNLIMSPLCVNE